MIDSDDLRITLHNPNGPGGQTVGTPHDVKVEHIPTGLVAIVPTGYGSQFRAKNVAIRMIESALTDPEFRSR